MQHMSSMEWAAFCPARGRGGCGEGCEGRERMTAVRAAQARMRSALPLCSLRRAHQQRDGDAVPLCVWADVRRTAAMGSCGPTLCGLVKPWILACSRRWRRSWIFVTSAWSWVVLSLLVLWTLAWQGGHAKDLAPPEQSRCICACLRELKAPEGPCSFRVYTDYSEVNRYTGVRD